VFLSSTSSSFLVSFPETSASYSSLVRDSFVSHLRRHLSSIVCSLLLAVHGELNLRWSILLATGAGTRVVRCLHVMRESLYTMCAHRWLTEVEIFGLEAHSVGVVFWSRWSRVSSGGSSTRLQVQGCTTALGDDSPGDRCSAALRFRFLAMLFPSMTHVAVSTWSLECIDFAIHWRMERAAAHKEYIACAGQSR
jgi:hypothetical protein